ncbi:hypothetical protein K503DRAFT_866038 [Rhizopogon vinicolor AM-OR11-026]|uniref:Uncharacterized protein n=1 Tax=Rhizopogon vinicolor AM-OR11-026 TaxID=1314800 RepID=A0A1B7N187_9AGAM|nr:hypothetical protein K503DRAFT_866038 [Rhizopogon vinicolor AM-OR11-026]
MQLLRLTSRIVCGTLIILVILSSSIALASESPEPVEGDIEKRRVACYNGDNKPTGKCADLTPRGITSTHNCVEKRGGTAYWCVHKGEGVCVTGKKHMKKADMEGGECLA